MGILNKLSSFGMKKMLQSQMKGVPEAEQERIIGMFEKNPEFFATIGKEVQEAMKSGKDQMSATMEVMNRHKDALQKLMGGTE